MTNIEKIMLMVMSTFLIVAFIMPFVQKIAVHIGAVDKNFGGRHIHKKAVPKMGGIAMFAGLLLGYLIFGNNTPIMIPIIIGATIVIFTGLCDDIKDLTALPKFIGHLIAASVVVFAGNLTINSIDAFGLVINFGIFAYPLTILFIVACINCINLIDGLDGLSSGISSIYFLTIGIICIIQGKFGIEFILTGLMLGSTLGFLVYNFNPATIFAGDCGATFMGYMISIIALLGFKNVTLTSLIIPLLILAIPILDTLFAIIRRSIKGEKISEGDKYHIHHQLLNRNFSQRTTVLIIYLINGLFAFASILYIMKDKKLAYAVYGLLLLIVGLFILKTNVVFKEEPEKKFFKKKVKK